MIDFKEISLEDKVWMEPIFRSSNEMNCENAFGTMYIWQDVFNVKVAFKDGFLFRIYGDNLDKYVMPLGNGDLQNAFNLIMNDAKQRVNELKITSVTSQMIEHISSNMSIPFKTHENRDIADYIYNTTDLVNLSGKKYHSKRNHITKFLKLYTNWSYETLNQNNLDQCEYIIDEWCKEYSCSSENGLDKERFALEKAIKAYQDLGFVGGLIKINDRPVAFSMGEEINDEVFVIHFEKALPDYIGLYAMINREVAARELTKYKFINREEDLGLEGLRKSKLSYKPAMILSKSELIFEREVLKI